MKFIEKHRMKIILFIGILFIAFGVLQAVLKIEINNKTVENISFLLMLIAVFLFFAGRKKKKSADNAEPEENERKTPVEDGRDNQPEQPVQAENGRKPDDENTLS